MSSGAAPWCTTRQACGATGHGTIVVSVAHGAASGGFQVLRCGAIMHGAAACGAMPHGASTCSATAHGATVVSAAPGAPKIGTIVWGNSRSSSAAPGTMARQVNIANAWQGLLAQACMVNFLDMHT
jgi:hypothetical protein